MMLNPSEQPSGSSGLKALILAILSPLPFVLVFILVGDPLRRLTGLKFFSVSLYLSLILVIIGVVLSLRALVATKRKGLAILALILSLLITLSLGALTVVVIMENIRQGSGLFGL